MRHSKRGSAATLALSALLLLRVDAAAAATIMANPSALPTLGHGGFEKPELAAGTFALGATGSAWIFAGITGVAYNGSAYANPLAPEGNQVGIVTNDQSSIISQTFSAPAGRYEISLKSAQQPGNHQSISVRINGTQVALVAPPDSQWHSYTSTRFDLAAGTHTISLVGLDPGGDQTAFVDAVKLTSVGYLVDGGFEKPEVAAGTHLFAATGSAWSFNANSGITGNGGTYGTPAAAEGDQAGILRGANAFSQSFSVPETGRYRLAFLAALRTASSMKVTVSMDGNLVGTFKPADANYSARIFDGLLLTAGTHVLSFGGESSESGERRAPVVALDDVRLTSTTLAASRWSDPATWGGGVVPGANDEVYIPSDAVVLLDTAAAVDSLTIQGELHCDDADISLDANDVLVSGRLVCGSPFASFVNTFTLTLFGPDQGAGGMHGHKFLAAMAPGAIELHGEKRRSWTRLNATVRATKTSMSLADAVDWRIGDVIVIAPTLDDASQGEEVLITDVSPDGKNITFDPPLAFDHYGEQSTYSNGTRTWTLDERAEVGLLSRNIKIQGDESSQASRYGGHMMTMHGSTIRASGIELFRMGQKKLLRRYPFHWHLARDASGQYIESSSVHASYNRCITIHGTNYARVADNVCYDFMGHGFFLEDGIEQHNVLDRNLAIWTRRPSVADQLLPTDNQNGTASVGPAAFWISNPTNTLTGNVAAGSEGSGFWYRVINAIDPGSDSYAAQLSGYNTMNPKKQPFGVFADNHAHTSQQGFSSCEFAAGFPGMEPPGFLISRFTTSNVVQGMWPCVENETSLNGIIEDSIIANAHNGMQAPSPMTMKNSLFVGYSANPSPLLAESSEILTIGISVYDQGFFLDNAHFVNYDRKLSTMFFSAGGAHKLTNNRVQGLTFDNAPHAFIDFDRVSDSPLAHVGWGDVINDLDGSLVGAGLALVTDHPLMSDATCARPVAPRVSGYACPYRYSRFWINNGYPGGTEPRITVQRSDGATGTANSVLPSRFVNEYIANGRYHHSYRYDAGIPRNEMYLTIFNGHPGDESVHEILDMPSTFAVWGDTAAAWTAASDLADLMSGPGHRYYYRASSGSLYIKSRAANEYIFTGQPWFAGDLIRLCMTAPVAGTCQFNDRTVSPPEVTITSSARVAAGTALITGTAISTSGSPIASVKLFVDEVEHVGTQVGTVWSFPVPVVTGKYAIKLVAQDTSTPPNTYTALQQLVVGEPEARVEIMSHPQNSTYTPATIGNLTFNVHNLAAAGSGAHLHWLDNGIDQGDVAGSSIALSTLSQGRHDIDLAVAKADHSVLPGRDRRVLWMVRDGVVADFEDHEDLRALFWRVPSSDPQRLGKPAFGRRETARIDGNDDWNSYSVFPWSATLLPQARLSLTLSPPQDWSAYSRMAIKHQGNTFELLVKYANGTSASAGFATATAGDLTETFLLPVGPNTTVSGIEILQDHKPPASVCGVASPPPACLTTQYLYEIKLIP